MLADGSKIAVKAEEVAKLEKTAKNNANMAENLMRNIKLQDTSKNTIEKVFNATNQKGTFNFFSKNKGYNAAKEYFKKLQPKNIKEFKTATNEGFSGVIDIEGKSAKVTVRKTVTSTKTPTYYMGQE